MDVLMGTDFLPLTSARERAIVSRVQNSPMFAQDVFLETWMELAPGITSLAKGYEVDFSIIPAEVEDNDLSNAILLIGILDVAENGPKNHFSYPADFIRPAPIWDHHASVTSSEVPFFTITGPQTYWNYSTETLYHLVCPDFFVCRLGSHPGARSLRAWYYSFLGLVRNPNRKVKVPPHLERFVQFLSLAFSTRRRCPLTGCYLSSDQLLCKVLHKLFQETAYVGAASRKLHF